MRPARQKCIEWHVALKIELMFVLHCIRGGRRVVAIWQRSGDRGGRVVATWRLTRAEQAARAERE